MENKVLTTDLFIEVLQLAKDTLDELDHPKQASNFLHRTSCSFRNVADRVRQVLLDDPDIDLSGDARLDVVRTFIENALKYVIYEAASLSCHQGKGIKERLDVRDDIPTDPKIFDAMKSLSIILNDAVKHFEESEDCSDCCDGCCDEGCSEESPCSTEHEGDKFDKPLD